MPYAAPASASSTSSETLVSYLHKQRYPPSLSMSKSSPVELSTSEPSRHMSSSIIPRSKSSLRSSTRQRSPPGPALVSGHAPSLTQILSSSENEPEQPSKSPLVRKRSGEVVKPAQRPYLHRAYSSMPSIATCSKSVHFNDSGNETRHFLRGDTPNAVVVGSPPMKLYDDTSDGTKYSFDRMGSLEEDTKTVQLEHLILSSDQQTLAGTCAVRNLSFHKRVAVHFTVDDWKTVSEVEAEYYNDVINPLHDRCNRFQFRIKLSHQANTKKKTLLLCVRYNVGGEEFWDNNNDINYRVDILRNARQPLRRLRSITGDLETQPIDATPYHQESPVLKSNESLTHLESNFVRDVKSTPKKPEGSPEPDLRSDLGDIHTEPPAKDSADHNRLSMPSSLPLPATPNEPNHLNSLMPSQRSTYFNKVHQLGAGRRITPVTPPAASISYPAGRPAMDSDQYQILLQRCCYFVPGSENRCASPQLGIGTPIQYQSVASNVRCLTA